MAAASASLSNAKTALVNIRVKSTERSLIDQAASLLGKSRSEFMLEASRQAATEALLDQTLFRVDRKTYNQFLKLLDAPPKSNPKLRKLLNAKPPWKPID